MKLVIIGDVDLTHLNGPSSIIVSLLKGLKENNVDYEFIQFKELKKIFKLLIRKDLIINVHVRGYKVPAIICLISKLNKHNKYYLTVHGITSYEYKLNNLELNLNKRKEEKYLYENFPNLIFVSNLEKELFNTLFNTKANKYVVNNGLNNYNNELINKSKHKFLYAGGYSDLKNPLECIEIFKEVTKIYPDASLTMCGPIIDNELYLKVKDKVNNLNIQVLDKVSKEELNKYYFESMFILAPSKFDTFNMTVLEAMNYGCIPIISNNCGVKELIDGIIYKDINEITNKLKNININELSNNNFNISLHNTYKDMTNNYLKVFNYL